MMRSDFINRDNDGLIEDVAGLSVTIRNQLNAGAGVIHALEATELDAKQAAIVANLREVMSEFRDMADWLECLRQLENRAGDAHRAPVDLSLLFEAVEADFALRCRSRAMKFVMTIDKNVPATIDEDGERLAQVIRNLLYLALHDTTATSLIVHVSVPNENALWVRVSHDGRTSFDRAGLGDEIRLLAVRNMVGDMGGGVVCSGKPGVGHTAEIRLPLRADKAKSVIGGLRVAPADVSGLRVLIAEDQPTNRRVLQAYLSQWGVEADEAENGHEALSLAQTNPYDLILMDIRMPIMSGAEAAVELRQSNTPCNGAFIVSLTADVFFQDSDDAFVFDAFLSKPVSPERLFTVLEKVSERLHAHAA